MRGISRMTFLWIGLFAMASVTGAATWTYAAGLLAAAAVLPLAMAATAQAAGSGRANRRYSVRRAPVTVVWQQDNA